MCLFPTTLAQRSCSVPHSQCLAHCTIPTSLAIWGPALGDNAIPCPPQPQPLDSPGVRGLAAGRAEAGENTSPLEPGWQIIWLVTRWLYRMSLVVEMKPQLWQTPEWGDRAQG